MGGDSVHGSLSEMKRKERQKIRKHSWEQPADQGLTRSPCSPSDHSPSLILVVTGAPPRGRVRASGRREASTLEPGWAWLLVLCVTGLSPLTAPREESLALPTGLVLGKLPRHPGGLQETQSCWALKAQGPVRSISLPKAPSSGLAESSQPACFPLPKSWSHSFDYRHFLSPCYAPCLVAAGMLSSEPRDSEEETITVSVLPGMVNQLLAPVTLLVTATIGPEPPLSTSSMPAPLITNSVLRPGGVGSTLPPWTSLAQPLSPTKIICLVVGLFEINPHVTCFFDIFSLFWLLKKKKKNFKNHIKKKFCVKDIVLNSCL